MKVTITGIPLYGFKMDHFLNQILETIENNKRNNYCISATGAHGLVHSKKNPDFAKVLRSFHYNLPDGMPGVWVGRLKGAKDMERCYGPDFFKAVLKETAPYDIKHYFCGGKEGVAVELKKACEDKFKNYNIIGTFSPPFREMNDDELKILADDINSKCTNIVWIGLSTPKQEIFASRLAKYTNVHFIATVGAAFDFHTGKVKQAPAFIQNLGLEWLFRLVMEPKRLYKRYFEIVPMFIYYNIKEFSIYIFNKMLGSKEYVNG